MKRTFKKAISVFLCVAMLLCAAPLNGFVGMELPDGSGFRKLVENISAAFDSFSTKAQAATYSGSCGSNLTWSLNTSTGVLNIAGTGAMTNYSSSSYAPWYSYRSYIKSVNIGNSITTIGDSAFAYCDSLTSVTIPDSVTTIGDGAFYYCDSLTSVTIPDSVTTIGYEAFSDCDSLTSVTIPDSVTTIGDDAFSHCDSLTSVTIPDSVTTIGEDAFYSCDSLTSITIPDSVTTIGNDAFGYCESLTSITVDENNKYYSSDSYGVLFNKDKTTLIQYPIGNARTSYTIPNSVTTIGNYAFCDCYSLTSVTIPDSVTTIGGWAFYYCKSLTSVTIPDSVTTIGDRAFYYCKSLTDVYYTGTQEQWKKISIGSENEDLTSATIHYSYLDVPKGKYAIKVIDSSGKPIADALVDYDEVILFTDKDGVAYFHRATIGQPSITVEKNGYHTYNNQNQNYAKSEDGYEIITLYSVSEAKHLLKSADYHDSRTYSDVLVKTKRISRAKRENMVDYDDGEFSLFVSPISTEDVTHYCVYQGKNRIAYSETGTFENLNIYSFDEGGNITIRVYSGTNYVATPINLIVCEEAINENAGIQIGEKISFKVPDSIPFVGGSDFTFDFPVLPIDIYVDEETAHVGVNIDITGDGKTDDEKASEKVKDIKQTFDNIKKYGNKNLSKDLIKNLTDLAEKNDDFNLPAVGKVKVTFAGYGEGTWNENGISTIRVHLYIAVNATVNKTFQTAVWVIPVVVDITVGVEGKVSATINYDLQKQILSGDVVFSLKPNIEIMGAVGVGKAVGVGAYGSAELLVEIQLFGTTTPSGLNKIDLTGELGVKAYLGPLTYKNPIGYNTWHIYTRTQGPKVVTNSLECELAAVNGSELSGGLYDINSYSLADTSYLKNESRWLANNSSMQIGTQSADSSIEQIRPMLTETYRNAQPVVATNGKDTVMVFVGADTTRTSANIARVMYSFYNSTEDTWSVPVQLDSNSTFDSTPYIYSDGTDIWVVYCDSSKVFDDTFAIEDFTTSQTIKAAKFNSETGKFDEPVIVAEADRNYLSVPEITVVNSVPTVIWQENSSSDFFGLNSTNEIHYATFNGTSWSSESVAAYGLNTIVGYAVGEVNSEMKIAYITDSDNNLETLEDRQFFVTGNSAAIDSGIVSNPIFAYDIATGKNSLWWYDEGGLSISSDCVTTSFVFESGFGLTDNYSIVDNRIVFVGATENSSNLFTSVYSTESGSSNPVQITDQSCYIDSFDTALVNGRTLAVMTQRDVTLTEDEVDDSCTLSWTFIGNKNDIAVTSVSCDSSLVELNTELPINISVDNLGDTDISSLTVNIYNGSGDMVYTDNMDVSIAAGSSVELTVNMPLGTQIDLTKYTVEVLADESDSNTNNNRGEVTIGYTNFEVVADYTKIGEKCSVVALVTNNSYTSSAGKLYIYSITDEEKLLTTLDIDELGAKESQLFTFDVDEEMIGSKSCVIEVVAEADVEGQSTFNNRAQIYVDLTGSQSFSTGTIIAVENSGTVIDDESQFVYGIAPGLKQLSNYVYTSETDNSISYTNLNTHIGTGTRITVMNPEGTVLATYTAVIFGDVNGDGWYDGEDAFLVNLIAKGMLSKDDVGEAIWTAADCNHDGEINEADVDLLSGAGLKLNDVDQTKPVEELATNSDYIEYVMLIDQSAGFDVEPDTDETEEGTTTPETNETVEPDEPATENNIDFEVIFTNILELFKKIFAFVFSFIIK